MQGKTVIIIAHRLSTIRNADKIIVMEKGHLVEEGKHDQLVAAGGRYAQMWNHYTEAVDWKIGGNPKGYQLCHSAEIRKGGVKNNE